MELLREKVDNPRVMLTNLMKKNDMSELNGHEDFYREHASPDGHTSPEENRKNLLRRLSRTQPSIQFLDTGYHFLLHDFPWKREELLRELESTDGSDVAFGTLGIQGHSNAQASCLLSPMSRRSRLASDGSEDVFEPDNIISDVTINMEEEQNEEQRRIQANLKWNLRRQKIEQEINRLRHYSINRSRAAAAGGAARLRHSVSFGDDLETQLESSRMRALQEEDEDEENSEEEDMRRTNTVTSRSRLIQQQSYRKSQTLGANSKPFTRAVSMPDKDMDGAHNKQCFPVLKLHELPSYTEEEEEEEDERMEIVGRLGLPPKDVPLNSSLEQIQEWEEKDEVD